MQTIDTTQAAFDKGCLPLDCPILTPEPSIVVLMVSGLVIFGIVLLVRKLRSRKA